MEKEPAVLMTADAHQNIPSRLWKEYESRIHDAKTLKELHDVISAPYLMNQVSLVALTLRRMLWLMDQQNKKG